MSTKVLHNFTDSHLAAAPGAHAFGLSAEFASRISRPFDASHRAFSWAAEHDLDPADQELGLGARQPADTLGQECPIERDDLGDIRH